MELISDILYWISTGLLVPVIVILIILFIRALLLIGSFFGQYLASRKSSAQVRKALTDVTPDTLDDVINQLPKKDNVLVIAYIKKMIAARDNKAEVKRLLAEFEIDADKDLSTSKMLTKLGPMMGLMGTLIPMGPALAGLNGTQHAGSICHHRHRSRSCCHRLCHPTGQATLVSSGHHKSGVFEGNDVTHPPPKGRVRIIQTQRRKNAEKK